MNLTIAEAMTWIHSRLKFGSRPGLIRVETLLRLVDNPEKKVPTIHVAGTNGKGSTVSYLRAMIQETGLTVGSFTSPYIESFNERIAINGQAIPDQDLIDLVQVVRPLVEQMDQEESIAGITEFELITVMGFLYFFEQQVDVAIIEVGIGGLLDSTNVITPLLTAITTIGMDHMDILGDSIEEIAAQKAGIIKQHVPLVTGRIQLAARRVIDKVALGHHVSVAHFDEEYQVHYRHPDENWGEVFDFTNEAGKVKELKTALLGRHQVENAGVAIQLFYLFCQKRQIPFLEKTIRAGLKKANWPVRMERLSSEPLIILDGAHNEHAVQRLVENMKQEFKEYHIYILFSALETKSISAMLHQLLAIPNSKLYLTSFDYPNALRLEKNYQNIDQKQITVASLWPFALGEILEKMGSEDLLLVTGSLYFVSEVRKLLQELHK